MYKYNAHTNIKNKFLYNFLFVLHRCGIQNTVKFCAERKYKQNIEFSNKIKPSLLAIYNIFALKTKNQINVICITAQSTLEKYKLKTSLATKSFSFTFCSSFHLFLF